MSKKSKPLSELDKKLSPKVRREAKIKADQLLKEMQQQAVCCRNANSVEVGGGFAETKDS